MSTRAIVGGGLLGMALAHRLARLGESVTIYEAAPDLGGLASPWRIGPVVWDRHYHVILASDRSLRSLLRELGIEKEIQWKKTRTGFFTGGALHSLSNAVEFLRFPALGFVDKARLAAMILRAAYGPPGRGLERISAEAWARRWSGTKTAETLWLPLLRAKLGDAATRATAAFLSATIRRMYSARGSGQKEELFGYVPGGYARTLESFRNALEGEGVEVRCGISVRGISARGGQVRLELDKGEAVADRAVVTVAPALAARICAELTAREIERLERIPYIGVVCASVLLRRSLSDFYITNLTDPGLPFTGIIEMSALVDRSTFGGLALLYLPRYLDSRDLKSFEEPDDAVEKRFLAGLSRVHPTLRPEDVVAFRVSRARYVAPISTIDCPRGLEETRTSIPGVDLLSSAHLVDATLNVNETVALANRAVLSGLAA